MDKRLKTIVLSIVALLVILIVVGPIIIGSISRRNRPRPPHVTHPISIKAHGKIAEIDNHLILSTPHGTNNYILISNQSQTSTLRQYAKNNQEVFVFGVLMMPDLTTVKNTKIVADIDIVKFDTKDFNFKLLSPQEMTLLAQKEKEKKIEELKKVEAEKLAKEQKLKDKIAFRDQVLRAVGEKGPQMDVISGKLKIATCLKKGERVPCLLVQDKDKVIYILSNREGAVQASINDFLKFKNFDMEVVIVGRFGFPDENVVAPEYPGRMTFVIKGIYTPDLKQFIQ